MHSIGTTVLPTISVSTTHEEFFVEGLADPSPPSPSLFLGLPTMDYSVGQHSPSPDDIVLAYVSRFLMEDDNEDKLLRQDSDHHALLQAQEPFAQILLSSSISTNSNNSINRNNMEGANNLLQGSSGDQCSLSSVFSMCVDSVGAFSKSIQEASRFCPRDNSIRKEQQVHQRVTECSNHRVMNKRYSKDEQLEVEVCRARKAMVMMEEIEEVFGKMMLRGYETWRNDMEKLHIAKADEAMNSKKSGSKAKSDVVDLGALLIRCAQAVAAGSVMPAQELLKQIRQHASSTGDATQRLAQCFSKGLEARLAGTGSQLCLSGMADRTLVVEYLKAYKLYMAACCFNRVALFFNIMTIENAMAGKSKLHIVDFGPHHGFQWAGLLRWMSSREGGPPEVKITAINRLQPKSCPAEGIDDTGHRLGKCALEFGVPFKFHAITAKWETICADNLNTDVDEVLVVNDLFNFSILTDESIYFDRPSPRDVVLNNIRKMRPDVFIQGVVNSSYGTSFLARFREAVFYYSALFDMLDATIPREDNMRLVLEQGMLGHSVLNVIACEGMELMYRPEKYRQWQVRNQRAGLRQLPLKPNIIQVLKEKVMKDHHKDFFVGEDGQWLLQGWMGRILYAHSTWVADAIAE
ncbi:hypothetical protein HU200_066079 [Digitaria exilis]|uniref:Scarecrow-like protein 9 n=1 Tax=Digitaria exilis TaxID=1010633 RepID=A0A834ZXJ6_9POAL|nr:hypothetical protein HU200_066079 [Digitaria exilis]